MRKERLEKIITRTAKEFEVCPLLILSKDGSRPITKARAVVAFLLKDELSTAQISSLLGRKNSNYKRACVAKVYAKSLEDHDYNMKVLKLSEEFGVRWN